jgi:class 3 adenylate cyclase
MKGIIESHGGTVEKFIGDAIMAVFGVPQLHEDDALRAVRVAVEMRDAVPELVPRPASASIPAGLGLEVAPRLRGPRWQGRRTRSRAERKTSLSAPQRRSTLAS